MASPKPRRKRDRVFQWISGTSTRPSSHHSALSATSTSPPNPNPSGTSIVGAQSFEDRVFLCLSQQEQDTIRQYTVSNAADINTIVRQALTATRQKQAICQSKRWTFQFGGQSVVLQKKADNIVSWLDRFKAVGDVVSNADPIHVGLPWAGIRLLLEAATSEKSQMAALLLGLETALYLSNRLQAYMTYMATLPPSLTRGNLESCLIEFHALILRFLGKAIRLYQKGSITRVFDAFWRVEDVSTFEDECHKMANRADIEASTCNRHLTAKQHEELRQTLLKLDAIHTVQGAVERLEHKLNLDKLPVAVGAAFNSYQDELDARCHPDTRVDLLRDIYTWAGQADGKSIFWLNGGAGTGKSTISRTVAQTFSDHGRLGASFFFKRGERDRENARLFVSTIVREMVRQIPALRPHVHQAIEDDPEIATRALKEQFDKLIFLPCTKVGSIPLASVVLVVDALDECDREGDINVMIAQLSRLRELRTISIRAFLTSRPEVPIRHAFTEVSTAKHRDLILHNIPPSTIRHDISIYLQDEFTRIRDAHRRLSDQSVPPGWPDVESLNALTDLAVPLFIVAATVCRFVGDLKGNPQKRLRQVLDQPIGQRSQLELTYLPVLRQLLAGVDDAEEKEQLCRDFHEIVGSIVLLANPLSTTSLAKLLQIEKTDIDDQLRCLHSVLWIPSDPNAPIHLLHLSFREFLLKKRHSDLGRQFTIDKPTAHGFLLDKCLTLLRGSQGLRKDICHLERPGILRSEISYATINASIPQHLQYACCFWIFHLQQSERQIRDGDEIDSFLRTYFLHWLECMSLISKIPESIGLITTLQSQVAKKDSQVSTFMEDARRFTLTFSSILAQAPLQVYGSPWHFSPLKSPVRHTFRGQRLPTIQIRSLLSEQWSACLQTYEGHSSLVNSVVFSRDGSRVASGSGDSTVRVWDVQTGECQHTLEGHSDWVNSVVFSRDGSRVASGSHDSTVRVWDITSATEVLCHNTYTTMNDIEFSDDGSTILVNGELLPLPPQLPLSSTTQPSNSDVTSRRKLGLGGEWIMYGSERILWLPPEYRPGDWASYMDIVAIGSGNGRVTIVSVTRPHGINGSEEKTW
ncbi:hypothetical protein A1O1_00213 [Capronia coronata CBS 617.96]|uniref:Uncharacterized protein n=1 Tax=Capronia coronata CBS 617.96 TaxID=1182541 RepID=W9ZKQ8_9EURO|nr:uncharacterized protein A1O1_00213 [Capronia coronata CBS 617.96]EXJ95094.1 hypothetical protein A1O1_00213 [Capronia coronata CBS 617.96]